MRRINSLISFDMTKKLRGGEHRQQGDLISLKSQGYTQTNRDGYTDREEGDIIGPFLFFQNNENRLKVTDYVDIVARCSVIGLGTMLQVGRSRVRFPMK
jgi:hypothetical protein